MNMQKWKNRHKRQPKRTKPRPLVADPALSGPTPRYIRREVSLAFDKASIKGLIPREIRLHGVQFAPDYTEFVVFVSCRTEELRFRVAGARMLIEAWKDQESRSAREEFLLKMLAPAFAWVLKTEEEAVEDGEVMNYE